jgi:DNA-binding NtrC family response regulator
MSSYQPGILIVDDEPIVRDSLTKWFLEEGYRAEAAEDAAAALRKIQHARWDLLLVDLRMPGMDGLELMQHAKEINRDLAVIVITAYASVETAVRALKEGASDYITKPIDPNSLTHLVRKCLDEQQSRRESRLRESVGHVQGPVELVGESPEMHRVIELIHTVAQTDTTVIIRGESGTGKELVARAIHAGSPRRGFRFVTVNCDALTEPLQESELFGIEQGAAAGAQPRRTGKIELADGGTLFLDEVGTIGLRTQMDLLRAIETHEFRRVGGTDPLQSDFRVICATSRNLEDAVRDGRFREDLYYRLNVFSLEIPPLRGRRGDVARLAHHFVQKFARQLNKPVASFSVEAINALRTYDWPGNVLELENAIERAVVVADGTVIERDCLPVQASGPSRIAGKRLEEVECRHIKQVLSESAWNISRAAGILGIDRVTLYHKIERYNLRK